jgi:hypothetical protein
VEVTWRESGLAARLDGMCMSTSII